MTRKQELIEKVLSETEKEETKYTLIINEKAPNQELMVLKENHLEGAKKYYPEKEFKVLVKKKGLKDIANALEKLDLTEYDVIFLDHLEWKDFYTIKQFLLTFTGVRSIVINSICRNMEGSITKKTVEKIKKEIDSSEESYHLKAIDELLLDGQLPEIEKYASEKGISLIKE